MSSRAARAIAEAVHRRNVRSSESDTVGRIELAIIRAFDPVIQAELFTSHHIIEEGSDFHLSQFVRWWDANYGLLVNNVLICVEVAEGSWLAFDVRAEASIDAGIRPLKPPTVEGQGKPHPALETASESGLFTVNPTTGAVTWGHHVAKKMRVYDAAGDLVGYVPVFTTLP